jgi:predicted nuclease of predicted toxin-antitoxin system
MRFLVDRCAGKRLADWLHDNGHDVADASSWLQDPGDAAILQRAGDEDRILITIDGDFGLLVFAEDRPHRGMVRLPDCPTAPRIAIVRDLLARHGEDLDARAVITVRGGRVRISRRRPPG